MAANADDALYQHSLGVNWGYGTSILDTKHVKDEEGDMFVGGYYYRYMLQKNFGVEAGYKDAVDGIGSLLSSPLASVEDVIQLDGKPNEAQLLILKSLNFEFKNMNKETQKW